jgi:hypothetical protein
MGVLNIDLDISELSQYLENFAKEITVDVHTAVKDLAKGAYSHITEDAQKNLHSFREEYLKNLSPPELIDDLIWVITLDEKAEWIETGRPNSYDMKIGLLKKGKLSKDGILYRVVPMNQAKMPSQMSPRKANYEQGMVNMVRTELKKKGLPYRQIETTSAVGRKTGNTITDKPKVGALHRFDIKSGYFPGQANTDQLHGINIYQTPSKKEGGGMKRSITTFRTVTSDESQQDKWIHPPVEARDFFEKARQWAEEEWNAKIFPAILEKYK